MSYCKKWTSLNFASGGESRWPRVCLNQSKSAVERLSFECRETKTKVITLANRKVPDNPVNQSKLEASTCSRHKARGNVRERVMIGLVLLLICRESGAGFLSQSLSVVRQNQRHSIENQPDL